jgi:hypothetical protein
MADFTLIDGAEKQEFTWQNGMELVRRHTSLDEAQIMRENQLFRSDGGSRNLSFGKLVLRMSQAQYQFLIRVNPALKSKDPKERTRAWQRLTQDGGYRNLQTEDH